MKHPKRTAPERIAFDRASRRRVDENGFLHVSLCHISKETVNEYYGSEIPGWQTLGLDPSRVYKGYRSGKELEKAAPTFNGLPLLKEHRQDSADDPQTSLRVGNLGTEARFNAPYLDNSLIIQDAEAIAALSPADPETAPKRELSASYRYVPVFQPGSFNGERYDFVMTEIRGNHVALVEDGRAGPDVVVSDADTINPRGKNMNLLDEVKKLLSRLVDLGEAKPGKDLAALLANEPGAMKPAALGVADRAAGAGMPATLPGELTEDDEPDFRDMLLEHLDTLEDQSLAESLRQIIAEVQAQILAAQLDAGADNDLPGDPAFPAPGREPAMDRRTLRGRKLAMDARNVAATIREGVKNQIEAARIVRPLIGEVDPLAFDSAGRIYRHALAAIGKSTSLTDPRALKELCVIAADSRRNTTGYPVLDAARSAASTAELDPAFAHLANIRKA